MNQLFKSLSKSIALIVVASASIAFIGIVLTNFKSEPVVIAVVSMYSGLVSGVTTYYFTKKKYESDIETLTSNKNQ